MAKGWRNESRRHSLAARGVKTAVQGKPLVLSMKKGFYTGFPKGVILTDKKKGSFTEEYKFINNASPREKLDIITELEKYGKPLEEYSVEKSSSPLKEKKSGRVILFEYRDKKGEPSGIFYEIAYYDDSSKQILSESS